LLKRVPGLFGKNVTKSYFLAGELLRIAIILYKFISAAAISALQQDVVKRIHLPHV
jgi:hypothetical protein